MSKKRTKSPANIANNSIKWESNIISAELNDEHWSYSLVFLVENITEDEETINYINKGVLTGLRKRFTLISKEKILELINDFGNPKSKKGKEAPINFEICESGKAFLDKSEALPPQYLAKFIKWIMLTNKTEDMKIIGDTNKKTDEKSPKSKKSADKAEKAKPPSGKKGGQATGKRSPEPPSVKQEKKLRKRGDPDPDIQYIDDEPDDGSYRYFIVSGMIDCQVLEALGEIGCIATSIVRITRDIHIANENADQTGDQQEMASTGSDKEIENDPHDENLEKLNSFWTNIGSVLNNNKQLSNTPIVTLIAKHLMFPINIDDEASKNKCSMELFECLAVLIYDLLDLKRQWLNYLKKSKLILLPTKSKAVATEDNTPRESVKESSQHSNANADSGVDLTYDKVDMDYYKYLMKDVPIESSSVYLQMSAMLDQVEITCGDKTPEWSVPQTDAPHELNEETVAILRQMTENIYLPKDELLDLQAALNITNEDMQNMKSDKSTAVHALDSISLRDRDINTKSFGKNGVLGKELQMLITSFRHMDLLNVIPVGDRINRKRAARLQQLLNYLDTTTLSTSEINYTIKVFILESLMLSGVDENGFIRRNNEDGLGQKNIHQVWDDPFLIINEAAESVIEEELDILKKENPQLDKIHSMIHSEGTLASLNSEHDGILKSSRYSSRSQSPNQIPSVLRKSSVHFVEADPEESPSILSEAQMDMMDLFMNQDDETVQSVLLDYLENIKKRNLSEWCFEEFYEPHVLLQIIHKAIYKFPFVDIYNQRRVNGKIVVLHNPFHTDSKLNQQSWSQWLHSNVGFRNYLDFVNDKIEDWTRDEEAIYQANLLSKELQTSEVETKESETKEKPSKSNDKSKKAKPSKSRSRSSSRGSSVEENTNAEFSVVLPGSLKAQKLEQDKINKAKEEEELKKEQKRQLSAEKKASKDLAKSVDKGKDKRPSSKASNKSRSKKTAFDELGSSLDKENFPDLEMDKIAPEEYWPFVSYNLGNDLAHFSGNVVHLFPSDGSTIRIIRMQKLLDSTTVRVSVITTQMHVFTVHIVDPKYEPEEEYNNLDKILEQFGVEQNLCFYGASTCTFSDGVTIVASNKGYSGTLNQKDSFCPVNEKQNYETISPKNNDQIADGNQVLGTQDLYGEVSELNSKGYNQNKPFKDCMDTQNVPNIIVSTPDGVQVSVGYEMLDGNEKIFRPLLFMSKSGLNGNQTCSSVLTKNIDIETSRYITSSGSVILVSNNNSIRVLFPDGSVAISRLAAESTVSREEETDESKLEKNIPKESPTPKKKTKPSKSFSNEPLMTNNVAATDEVKQVINYSRKWKITLSNGEVFEAEADLNSLFSNKVQPISNETTNEEEPFSESPKDNSDIREEKNYLKSHKMMDTLLVSCATDPSSGETLVTRSDGTLLLVSQDAGIFLSEHSDGTRFTKYYILEKPRIMKDEDTAVPKSQITELLLIESKQYPAVTVDLTNGKIETRFGSMGSLLSDSNGYHLYKHSDNTEIEYRPDGEIIFTASCNSQMTYLQPDGPCSYVFNASSNIICDILDREGTEFIVDVNGDYYIKKLDKDIPINQDADQEVDERRQSNSAISTSNDNNTNIRKYDQHAPRIFTINSDGSGCELLRYRDIVDILVDAEIDNDHFHYREEVQESPQIIAHTILNPVQSKKPWKYEYSRKSVLPKGLTCRDLKSFPNKEIKGKGPEFGSSVGRGLQISTNPILSNQSKKATGNSRFDTWKNPMQFRQFLHYPIITEDIRNAFSLQLIEYNKRILGLKQHYKNLEIVDDRCEDEINVANEIKKRFEALNYPDKLIMNNAINCLSESSELKQEIWNGTNNEIKSDKHQKENLNQRKLDIILEQEKNNKEKEMESKNALKNKIVPSYFTSIYGKDFISNNAMDLQSLNKSMKLFPMSRDGTGVDEKNLEESGPAIDTPNSRILDSRKSSPKAAIQTPRASIDYADNKERSFDPKLVIKKKEKQYLYYDSSLIIPDTPKRVPIVSNLSLPKYLYSQRPVIQPNLRQAIIEDPVRRKVFTTSIVGGSNISQINQRKTRGLNVLPGRVDTGLLKEGQNYIFKIKLINTGPESSYFKVKQPPSSSGIWMEFLPGPIAAGLSRTISVHIYAIASNLECNSSHTSSIEQYVEIITNTDKIAVPISGRVMTADKYDSIYPILNTNKTALSQVSESLPAQSSQSLIAL